MLLVSFISLMKNQSEKSNNHNYSFTRESRYRWGHTFTHYTIPYAELYNPTLLDRGVG